ncbi:hypothetical protein Dsin_017202 [Dipteronia sinensis]|uniref:Uncharacterized protein n=1 Tax=Dipteronia sinensis TaxID=43782 RepID=A0AAE0E674_9ROSI|nr:hypothetical protein Dsin_017202 [Dipteronia sinensis]
MVATGILLNKSLIQCLKTEICKTASVAERVADERCESSLGSDGSLFCYQVRLDSAMNERTTILFCTTRILLRKIKPSKRLKFQMVNSIHKRRKTIGEQTISDEGGTQSTTGANPKLDNMAWINYQ